MRLRRTAPRAPRARLAAFAAAACLGAIATAQGSAPVTVGEVGPPPASVARAATTPVPATGDAKTACIYSHNSIRELMEIGSWIGRHFRCASIYNNVATWDEWSDPWFTRHADPDYAWGNWVRADPTRRRMVIGQSMIPTTGMPSDWRARGAAGEYDAYIRLLGANLVAAGLGRSVIRLGYEANGDWNVDNVGRTDDDFAQWRAYWARFARVLRSVPGARFTLDWNLNAVYRNIPPATIYPGDRAVDVIGIDVYDAGAGGPLPGAPSPQRWSALVGQPGGVRDIAAFARARGKPISVPEWGLVTGPKGGGDNPNFIASIAALVRNNTVAYQSYFNNDMRTGTLEIQKQPRAFAVYARSFGRASATRAARGKATARRS